MKVWFIALYEQTDDGEEPYSYDNYMDSGLFASWEAAQREADKLYEEALKNEADRYQRWVARYEARQKAYSLLKESGMDEAEIQSVFHFDPEEEHPEFSEPARRQVYWLDVAE